MLTALYKQSLKYIQLMRKIINCSYYITIIIDLILPLEHLIDHMFRGQLNRSVVITIIGPLHYPVYITK